MRPTPEMAAEGVNMMRHVSPPPIHPTCNPQIHSCKWLSSYSSSNDFGVNTAMIIIILLCLLICALALNTAIRCFLRRPPSSLPQTHQDTDGQHKPNPETAQIVAPTLVYSAGMKLGRADADCAICLSEFMEGEGIRVLWKCKHGFHVHCIQQWLSSHSSCPVCRSTCLLASTSSPVLEETDPAGCLQNPNNNVDTSQRAASGHIATSSSSSSSIPPTNLHVLSSSSV